MGQEGFLTAESRFDAIRKGREWVASLGQWPLPPVAAAHAPLPPRYSIEDILSIVDPDIRKPFDMREIILRLVDDSRLSEFKPSYGPNLLTCFANIMGACLWLDLAVCLLTHL